MHHDTKTCRKCGMAKLYSEFHKKKDGQNGLRADCKDCVAGHNRAYYTAKHETVRATNKAWRAANPDYAKQLYHRDPEKHRAASRAWAAKNPEKAKERLARWLTENADRKKASDKAWRAANPDKGKEYARRWYQQNRAVAAQRRKDWFEANKERWAIYSATRRATLLNATPLWADLDLITEIYVEAARITQETGIPHEVDHIVPLAGKTVCGLHVANNLQIIPATENRRKSNKLLP